MKTVRVVAAVIQENDRIFATQRGNGEYKGGWEFPGGKIEPGETPQQALVREIAEELNTVIKVRELITTVEYDYPAFHLSMDCFWCEVVSGDLELKEHKASQWLGKGELEELGWLPADREVVRRICSSSFFDPTGAPVSKEDFIQFYSKCYYLTVSAVAEQELEKILYNGIKSESDVIKILAWKAGMIDNKRSQNKGEICYKNTEAIEKFEIQTRRGKILADRICQYISGAYDELSRMAPEKVFDELRQKETKNLGTVYLLTLVYFISGGVSPIYDRFAQQALDAIREGHKPGEYVRQRTLPDKDSKNVFASFEKIYKNPLAVIFGEEYKKRRDIDRALWVYGHLFDNRKCDSVDIIEVLKPVYNFKASD